MWEPREVEKPSPFIKWESLNYLKWGYRVNINEPFVRFLFDRWREKQGINKRFPMSDEERLTFECDVIPYLESKYGTKAPAPHIPVGLYRDKLPIKLLARIYNIQDEAVLNRLEEERKQKK